MCASRTLPLVGIKAIIACSALIVAGCTTVGPDFEKPDTKVADNWLEADDARVDTATVAYQDWWDGFDDPVLTRLIDTAYQQNLGLQVAGLRILEARAQLGFAVGLQYPQSKSIGARYARSRSSKNAPPFSNLPDNLDISQTVNVWSTSFDATWEADVWGRFQRGIQAADASLAANMLNYDALLVTLTGDIASLYTSIRTFEERLAFARRRWQPRHRAPALASAKQICTRTS